MPQNVPTNAIDSCEYHSTLIMLFNSQIYETNKGRGSLTSSQRVTAENVVTEATIQLESLLRIYYLHHSFESYDGLLMAFLAHLCDKTLVRLSRLSRSSPKTSVDDIKTLRSTLILCFKGIHDQSKNFYISGIVFNVLKSRLSAEDQTLVGQYVMLKDRETQHEAFHRSQRVLSDYVVPSVSLHEIPDAARLSNIVKQFGDLSHEG
jgi:hypothetical protein